MGTTVCIQRLHAKVPTETFLRSFLLEEVSWTGSVSYSFGGKLIGILATSFKQETFNWSQTLQFSIQGDRQLIRCKPCGGKFACTYIDGCQASLSTSGSNSYQVIILTYRQENSVWILTFDLQILSTCWR